MKLIEKKEELSLER